MQISEKNPVNGKINLKQKFEAKSQNMVGIISPESRYHL